MTLRIEKFVPFRFCKRQLELTGLSALTGKNWRYSSSGKASLYHCLKSLNIQGKLLMPVYMCSSVKPVLRRLKISPIYYDLSETDLNADVEDIKKKILQLLVILLRLIELPFLKKLKVWKSGRLSWN